MSTSDEAGNIDWAQIDLRIDAFCAVVRHHLAGVTASTDANGYLRTSAAALLLRGLELLDAARTCREPIQFPAAELLLRSGVDVALKGRCLLASPDAVDEMCVMHHWYAQRKEQLSENCGGGKVPSMPAPFVAAFPPKKQRERNLFEIAEAIDAADLKENKYASTALWAYRCLYQWMSNAAAHSGLHAFERFTKTKDGQAALVTTPEALSGPERRHYMHVAAQLGELAFEVFTSFGLPLDDLEDIGVRLP